MKALLNPKFSAISYIGVFVAFLLPFVEFQCDGRKVLSLNGYQVAFGSEIDMPTTGVDGERVQPNYFVTAVLVLSAAAAALTFLSGTGGAFAAITALALLFFADPAFNNDEMSKIERASLGRFGYQYTTGYYLSLALLGCGAIYGFVASRIRLEPSLSRPDNTKRLGAILSELGLQSELTKFRKHGVTDELLPLLSDEQLQSIGIAKVGDRARLLAEFGR